MSVLQQHQDEDAGRYEIAEMERRFRKPLQKYFSKVRKQGGAS